MNTDTKVALITGSSRGIGADIARRLAGEGFRVVVNYAGNSKDAQSVADAIIAAGGEALVVKADVANPRDVAALFDAAQESFGRIDVVVNSAGVMRQAPIADFTDEAFDETMAINLKGSFNTCREAARRLGEGGRIINLSTSVIGMRLPTYGVYVASKAAIEAMTQVLAQEMRGRGITVNAVAPGPVATDLFLDGKSPELIAQLSRLNPMERLGQTGDIANVVAFLAGPGGGWINGQTIRANGGMC